MTKMKHFLFKTLLLVWITILYVVLFLIWILFGYTIFPDSGKMLDVGTAYSTDFFSPILLISPISVTGSPNDFINLKYTTWFFLLSVCWDYCES